MKTKVVRLNVEVILSGSEVFASDDLTPEFVEYSNFEENLQTNLELRGFTLEEEHESNRENSISKYLTFSKTEDDKVLKVVLVIRISDHKGRSKQISKGVWKSDKQLRSHFAGKQAKKLLDEKQLTPSDDMIVEALDIIFNETHFTSYESALRSVIKKVTSLM